MADLSKLVGLFSSALGHAGGIAECKDDWLFIELAHQFNESLGERARDSSSTYSNRRPQSRTNLLQ